MSRHILGPFNRVEGDLEVQYEAEQGVIQSAWVNSSLFRGFERILLGKAPSDALVYTPRICGICSVAQSMAAARTLAAAQQLQPALNGELASNLVLACENIADHLSHFYLFFMPDFARPVYQDQVWYADIANRFRAQTGAASADWLPVRAAWLHITGILAGKWPHSLSLQAGGITRAIAAPEKIRLLLIIGQLRQFLQRVVFGDSLENMLSIQTGDELWAWRDAHSHSDFGRFLTLVESLQLQALGHWSARLMSYGEYVVEQAAAIPAGVWQGGAVSVLDTATISEDISHAWLQGKQRSAHPWQGETEPNMHKPNAYTWCKAPRLAGQIVEVGALARQAVAGQALVQDLLLANGVNVANRVIARLLEVAQVVVLMEAWCRRFDFDQPFCHHAGMPKEAEGVGLVEAARGSLGHWLRIEHGKIAQYQIIAPTTWNFSPRDQQGQAGALEQALLGTDVMDEGAVKVQHIVRSFDPCMVCTVH